MNNTLPLLKTMILPSFFTFTKGVKIKKDGISIQKEFENIAIDNDSLKRYKDFFHWDVEIPLSFFYLMAQRAQSFLMLHSDFTIAIPGMIHLSNKIQKLSPVNYALPFDIRVSSNVEYKEVGSLIPKFRVDFFQNSDLVISCESIYLAKRKGNKKSKNSEHHENFLSETTSLENWDIAKNLGREYGEASGDKNPIHTSYLFAKLIGFPKPILHGWYSVSKIARNFELANNKSCEYIEVDFRSPVFLPSQQKLELQENANNELLFQLTDLQTSKITLSGKLK